MAPESHLSCLLEPRIGKWRLLTKLVHSKHFEAVVGIIILLNCVAMGMEAEALLGKLVSWSSFLQTTDHVFTSIFLFELIMRITVNGWQAFVPRLSDSDSFSNFFDAILVLVTGVFVVWIVPLANVSNGSLLANFQVLRAFRVARLVRVVSRVDAFTEVWRLIRGLSESVRVLLWTIAVVFFITYVFAIFGVVIISTPLQDDFKNGMARSEAEKDMLIDAVGGIMPFMYTLVQVLTLDSWNGILRPLMEYAPWAWVFFYAYISVAVIVLLNLVTAIIVENAFKTSHLDEQKVLKLKKKERERRFEEMTSLFKQIDKDNSGELTLEEFQAAFTDREVNRKLALLGVRQHDMEELFVLCDSGDNMLSLQEFFGGLSQIEGPAMAKEMFRVNKLVELSLRLIKQFHLEITDDIASIQCRLGLEPSNRLGSLRQRASNQPLFSVGDSEVLDSSRRRPDIMTQQGTLVTQQGNVQVQSEAAPTFPTVDAASSWSGHHFQAGDLKDPVNLLPSEPAQKYDGHMDEILKRLDQVMVNVESSSRELGLRISTCDNKMAVWHDRMDALATSVNVCKSSMSYVASKLGEPRSEHVVLPRADSRQCCPADGLFGTLGPLSSRGPQNPASRMSPRSTAPSNCSTPRVSASARAVALS